MNYTKKLSTDKLLAHILSTAEKWYGPRNHSKEILSIGFHDAAPQVFYPSSSQIQIKIGCNCVNDHQRMCYQIAHEAIHLLSPVHMKEATILEEGLATLFAHKYLQQFVGNDYPNSGDRRYDESRLEVENFLTPRPDAILRLRSEESVISHIESSLIRTIYPDVSASQAENLSILFHNESN